MTADGSGMRVDAHRSDGTAWTLVSRPPDPRLGPYVTDYQGYRERSRHPLRRLQAPFAGVPMIVTFGPSIDIINGGRPAERTTHGSFLAGLHDVHVITEYRGEQMGLQVNFTLLGAYRFLNITMSDIANRCLALGDLLGYCEAERLTCLLHERRGWAQRFSLLDRFLLERLCRSRPVSPDVAWALGILHACNGACSVGALSRDLGCSRKTLIQRFHCQVGLSPKAVANIMRFSHAVARIRRTDEESWAEVALACGYYDQAHFNRDFRRFSGRSPGTFRDALLPAQAGVAG
ncbi:MAG: helix-turn-helix domain-containing protein [Pseudomonadota bacterium]